MLLATRCPFCESVFRLPAEMLALRRGLVRCGHCQEVFDASSSLFELGPAGDFASATPLDAERVRALTSPAQTAPTTVAAPAAQPVVEPVAAPHEPAVAEPSAPVHEPVHESTHESTHAPEGESMPPLEPEHEPMPFTPTEAFPVHEPEPLHAPHDSHEPPGPFPAHDQPLAHTPPEPHLTFGEEPDPARDPLRPHESAFHEAEPAANFASGAWDPHKPFIPAHVDERLKTRTDHIPALPPTTGLAREPHPPHDEAHEPHLYEHGDRFEAPRDNEPFFSSKPPVEVERPAEAAAAAASAASIDAAQQPVDEEPAVWRRTARQPEPAVEHDVAAHARALREENLRQDGLHQDELRQASLRQDDLPHKALRDEPPVHDPYRRNEPRHDEPVLDERASLKSGPDGEPHFTATQEPFAVTPPDADQPFEVTRETRAGARRHVGWVAAGTAIAVLLVIALIVQLAWWQRESVMVHFPRTQKLFAQACTQFHCRIGPPHDIDGLQVEPADLRQIDGPHKLELKMPLHNRFDVALAYPAIELTLLDEHNNVAMRRVLYPQDYVMPESTIPDGLAPHITQTMLVHLDTGSAVATNFRVQIFYP